MCAVVCGACFTPVCAEVLDEAGIFNDEVKALATAISDELYAKSGVRINLVSQTSLREPGLSGVTLAFVPTTTGEHAQHGKVKIFAAPELLALFDADAVMSPYPHKGTILPILANPKATDIYNAAALNGFADIAERIAKTKGVELQTSIGSANRQTLNAVRFGAYGFLAGVVLIFLARRFGGSLVVVAAGAGARKVAGKMARKVAARARKARKNNAKFTQFWRKFTRHAAAFK